jgi:hypothetical protein
MVYGVGVTAVLNAVINGAIAWVSTRGVELVPEWSTQKISTITDTVATLFLLPLITCLLTAVSVHHDQRVGNLPQIRGLAIRSPALAALPRPVLSRAVACAVVSVVVFGPVAVVLLIVTDWGRISPGEFITFKTCFAVALGAVVTPLIALRAMADG